MIAPENLYCSLLHKAPCIKIVLLLPSVHPQAQFAQRDFFGLLCDRFTLITERNPMHRMMSDEYFFFYALCIIGKPCPRPVK